MSVEALDRRRDAIISGMYASGGGEELPKLIQDLDRKFDDLKKSVYGHTISDEIDPDDPFFARMSLPEAQKEKVALADPSALLYGFDNIEIEPG